jgi:hypothetical protein
MQPALKELLPTGDILSLPGDFVAVPLEPTDSGYPEFGFIFDHWRRLRGHRIGPSRREIDPVDLKSVLPRVGLVDVVAGGADFRFRLVGTEIYTLNNCELTGGLVSQLKPQPYSELLLEHFSSVVATGEPNAHEIRFITEAGTSRHYAAIRLPLSSDGRAVDGLLTVDNYGAHWKELHPYFDQLYDRVG